MPKGGMHPEDVRREIKKLDESTNCSGRENADSSPVYGMRKTAHESHEKTSHGADGAMKESGFAESNRAQRRR